MFENVFSCRYYNVLIGILAIFSGSGFSLKSDDKVRHSYVTYWEVAKPVLWTTVREKHPRESTKREGRRFL